MCAYAVAVPERAFQRDRHDLHVVVRMGSETLARSHGVVIQHPEGAEMHSAGIVIVFAKLNVIMVSLQPTVVKRHNRATRRGESSCFITGGFLILNF